ncbi:ABC transporter G family member 15 [Triticum urartu]|uniref:ABC transporter G family member 15 n=1 Tax=Triticum urartu TaxID=4572 RepID=M7YMB3_TRIUA|nr:ABC transporter G family member 15 [Triticum urartu]
MVSWRGWSAWPSSHIFFPRCLSDSEPPASGVVDNAKPGTTEGFLTWKDLSVTAMNGRKGRAVILDGLSGYARPGEVLALMGPSGCGKTTLLDTLAGRLGPNMKESGDIMINGCRQKIASRTSGISGGQRKRVSICIELLASPPLIFLDEPTSGLDSAASYHVMSRIAGIAKRNGTTVVAAIHQPSTEVFELFHGLCLLANGKTVYFGPASKAMEKLLSIAQYCRRSGTVKTMVYPYLGILPETCSRTITNFKTIYTKQHGLYSHQTHPKGNETMKTSRMVSRELTDETSSIERVSFSHFAATISRKHSVSNHDIPKEKSSILHFFDANGFPCPLRMNPSDHFLRMINIDFEGDYVVQQRQATVLTKLVVLTKRSMINMHRDIGYYWLRFGIYMALFLTIGTIFFNVGHNYSSIQVFEKERRSGHYGVTEFVIANTLSSTVYLGLICVLPAIIAYYLTGLQRGIGHFFFVATLWACTMLVEGLMMIVAAIVPDFLMGIITGSGVQGLLMLNAGFFRLPNDLPKPIWKYPTYYISYHKYTTQGLYKNEFLGLVFPNLAGVDGVITGQYILKNNFQVELGYSKWVDLAILLGMVIIYRFYIRIFNYACSVGGDVPVDYEVPMIRKTAKRIKWARTTPLLSTKTDKKRIMSASVGQLELASNQCGCSKALYMQDV